MLDAEKHCEILSANVRDRIAHMNSGFRLFVQLFSALVGGAIALKAQAQFLEKPIPADFVFQSNLLAWLIAVASFILVTDSFRSWYRHRKRLTEVAGKLRAKPSCRGLICSLG